jgi:hypothetical protein
MEHAVPETLDAGPRERCPRSPTILAMQSTSPIRRYVLLRQRDHDAAPSRWSMERIGSAPRAGAHVPAAAPAAKPSRSRT